MLLSYGNPKALRGERRGVRTAILHLAPAGVSRVANVCEWSTRGCRAACLNTAGRGAMASIQSARVRKTRGLVEDRARFLHILHGEIASGEERAAAAGLRFAVRLNGTSDLPWESEPFGRVPSIHPSVAFYDYTKSGVRSLRSVTDPTWPGNYRLTWSLAAQSALDLQVARVLLDAGCNVAVVAETPEPLAGVETIDGDEDDARIMDPRGVVVRLSPKGRAKADRTGFVVRQSLRLPARAPRECVATLDAARRRAADHAWKRGA